MPLQPHIRAPSGPKAKGDIKVAILTASTNCCPSYSDNKARCEFVSNYCNWVPKKWFLGSNHCEGVCTYENGCYCSAEGEGHFDFNEAMEEKVTFDSSEDTVSEFE